MLNKSARCQATSYFCLNCFYFMKNSVNAAVLNQRGYRSRQVVFHFFHNRFHYKISLWISLWISLQDFIMDFITDLTVDFITDFTAICHHQVQIFRTKRKTKNRRFHNTKIQQVLRHIIAISES